MEKVRSPHCIEGVRKLRRARLHLSRNLRLYASTELRAQLHLTATMFLFTTYFVHPSTNQKPESSIFKRHRCLGTIRVATSASKKYCSCCLDHRIKIDFESPYSAHSVRCILRPQELDATDFVLMSKSSDNSILPKSNARFPCTSLTLLLQASGSLPSARGNKCIRKSFLSL